MFRVIALGIGNHFYSRKRWGAIVLAVAYPILAVPISPWPRLIIRNLYRSIHNFGLSHFREKKNLTCFSILIILLRCAGRYVTIQFLLFLARTATVGLSIQLNRWFYSSSTYDIRFLAGLYAELYLATSYQAIRLLRNLAEFMLRDLSKRTQMLMAWFMMAGYLFYFR